MRVFDQFSKPENVSPQRLLFPDSRFPDMARRVPLLALADASGVPVMTRGRGAPIELRLVIEPLLGVEVDDRDIAKLLDLPFKVRELREALFPNGWERKRDWPRLREALLQSNLRGIPIDERGTAWFPIHVRQLPPLHSMTLDDLILLEIRFPPGAKSGPIIERAELRQLGVESGPRYRAYIGSHSLAWEPGKTRIINPKSGRHGWAGNPEAYPVLTLQDRRALAFGLNDQRNRTHDNIDKAFTELPGVVVIDKNAVDPITGAKGWRVLPSDAAAAVEAWQERRKKQNTLTGEAEHANRRSRTR